jgi:ABC-2 type transport system permease protein
VRISRPIRIYWLETKCEFLKTLRTPMYTASTLLFPLMFYLFFGLAMGWKAGTVPMTRYLLATYGVFGVMGASLYGFGAGLAVERGLGWLQVKRASPMPPPAYFAAKTAVCLLFGAMVVALLFAAGAIFGGVRMPAAQWLLLGGSLVLGAVPFCALGLAIGYFAGPSSAPAIVNLIYLPMAVCSGLWIPSQFLPHALQQVGRVLPAYDLAQLALGILRAPVEGTVPRHLEGLAGFTLLFLGLAYFGHRREEERIYG